MGYRNLLLEIINLPPNGFQPGDTVLVRVQTEYDNKPLPNWPVWVQVGRFNNLNSGWAFRTDRRGCAVVKVELLAEDHRGTWVIQAFLLKALPDGSWDGDSVTFPVT